MSIPVYNLYLNLAQGAPLIECMRDTFAKFCQSQFFSLFAKRELVLISSTFVRYELSVFYFEFSSLNATQCKNGAFRNLVQQSLSEPNVSHMLHEFGAMPNKRG